LFFFFVFLFFSPPPPPPLPASGLPNSLLPGNEDRLDGKPLPTGKCQARSDGGKTGTWLGKTGASESIGDRRMLFGPARDESAGVGRIKTEWR